MAFHRQTVAVDRKMRRLRIERADVLDVRGAQPRVEPAELPTYHLDRQTRPEYDSRGLGVAPDVVLGRRRHIPDAARIAAHDDAAAHVFDDPWMALQRNRNIRQRPERHHLD